MPSILEVLVATTMVHVFIYTPYMNQLIKQVNQIYFKYRKLNSCSYWLILNISLKVDTWVGGKAVPFTVPAFDLGAFVSLNLISTKQPSFPKIWEDYIE